MLWETSSSKHSKICKGFFEDISRSSLEANFVLNLILHGKVFMKIYYFKVFKSDSIKYFRKNNKHLLEKSYTKIYLIDNQKSIIILWKNPVVVSERFWAAMPEKVPKNM